MTTEIKYVLGVPIHNVNRAAALSRVEDFLRYPKKQATVVTPNPEFLLAAQKDKEFHDILWRADLAIPDGFGLLPASWVIGDQLTHRATGVDLAKDVTKFCSDQGHKLFLLGGRDKVAKKLADQLQAQYPRLQVESNSGPTAVGKNNNWDDQASTQKINDFKAAVLMVAFGQVKQEKWITHNLSNCPSVKVAIGVGGTFDYLSGSIRRAPKVMRYLGLEWLFRLILQPSRWLRIFDAVIRFPIAVLIFKWRATFRYRRNVVGFIANHKHEVLIVERQNVPGHWQLPQGGIDRHEEIKEAAVREMAEEIGTRKLKVLAVKKNIHRYTWGGKWHTTLNQARYHYGFRGQKQSAAIMEFVGNTREIQVDNRELRNHRWVSVHKILESVDPIRRPVTAKCLKLYQSLT